MEHPPILIVDENDNPIGATNRDDSIRSGHFHRIVRVMLFNPKGDVLLQKRSMKVFFPGLWEHSSSGHVDAGEDYLDAAKREMFEEIGVKGIDLKEVGYYKQEEVYKGDLLKRFNKVYVGFIDFTPQDLSKEEVDEVKWFSHDQLLEMAKTSDEITLGLKYYLNNFYNK